MTIEQLPAINASLNAMSLVLIMSAFGAIRLKKETLHRYLMTAAIVTSTVFLVCYLVYHFGADAKKYSGTVPIFYYTMLLTHVILAALVPFLITYVVFKILRGDRLAHRKVARIALPIWVYVSLTGVLIFFMVHR